MRASAPSTSLSVRGTLRLWLSTAVVAACAGHMRAPNVVPTVTLRVPTAPQVDTVTYQRSTTRDGVASMTGKRVVVSERRPGTDGVQLLAVEQRFPGGGGEIIDTAIAELATLRAVAHRSHQPTRVMRFDFGPSAASGLVTSGTADAAKVDTVHQELGGSIFDSNIIETVVAALPLRNGYATTLPFFIYERGGRVPMDVTVREQALTTFPVLGARSAWVVSVGVPDAPATVWVDAQTRAVLRVRYDIAARHMSFTDDRVTPIRRG